MTFVCCDRRRLDVIKLAGQKNAIEHLEVRDREEPDPALRQRTLFVRLLAPGRGLAAGNVRIDGGERVRAIGVEWAAPGDELPSGIDPELVERLDDPARTLVVRTTSSGDFSRYTLHIRRSSTDDRPPDAFDSRLAAIEFSFKVECPADYDCAVAAACPPEPQPSPDIDYLAKDYPGFRRLILDRLSLLVPGWRERSAADLGVVLAELVAYAADNLSYRQDAVANEAYLGTARRRRSIRRHARLVDYVLHDGCNARVFVQVGVDEDCTLGKGTELVTGIGGVSSRLLPGSREAIAARAEAAAVFETAHDARLFRDHNRLTFYTWGDRACCLPRGATRATLKHDHPDLAPGDVLVFEEEVSPTTGTEADLDRTRRWAVRLIAVERTSDPSGQLFEPIPADDPLPVTEIAWDAADALPFPLCLSAAAFPDVAISIARGNIVLADHGATVRETDLGPVPAARRRRIGEHGMCDAEEVRLVPARFAPSLAKAPVTYGFDVAAEMSAETSSREPRPAAAMLTRDPKEALPLLTLVEQATGAVWRPRRDLLASDATAEHIVVETEHDRAAEIRFGDGQHGRRPREGTVFDAVYRIGNGTAGNVGADAIRHIVTAAPVQWARNPLPAAGGVDPESVAVARRDAPETFRTQERAVTAADYAAAAERRQEVQRAAATFRWTGSWQTVFVTVDRRGGAATDAAFETGMRQHLEPFRMAGYDLEVDGPRYVALEVALHVCVKRSYFRSEVARAVRVTLGSGVTADGSRGAFHPDNFTFGEPVFLSRIVALAQAVEGVEAVQATTFRRLGAIDTSALESGVLPIGRLEMAELADSANFPERGRLVIEAGGGK